MNLWTVVVVVVFFFCCTFSHSPLRIKLHFQWITQHCQTLAIHHTNETKNWTKMTAEQHVYERHSWLKDTIYWLVCQCGCLPVCRWFNSHLVISNRHWTVNVLFHCICGWNKVWINSTQAKRTQYLLAFERDRRMGETKKGEHQRKCTSYDNGPNSTLLNANKSYLCTLFLSLCDFHLFIHKKRMRKLISILSWYVLLHFGISLCRARIVEAPEPEKLDFPFGATRFNVRNIVLHIFTLCFCVHVDDIGVVNVVSFHFVFHQSTYISFAYDWIFSPQSKIYGLSSNECMVFSLSFSISI